LCGANGRNGHCAGKLDRRGSSRNGASKPVIAVTFHLAAVIKAKRFMKTILLFSLLIPLHFIAQVQDDSLVYQRDILSNKIKTVTINTFFISGRDTGPDTASTETRQYDANGRILHIDYHVSIDKNNYTKHTDFFYNESGELRRIISNSANTRIDSTVYFNPQHYVEYINYPGKQIARELNKEDMTVTEISGKDTVVKKWKSVNADDKATAVINNGKYERTDTSYLCDNNGGHTMMMLEKYDSLNHLINTDYYNFKSDNPVIYSACYNDRLNMTFYIPKSKKGKISYYVSRKYGANGLLTEKKFVSTKKQGKQNPVIVMQLEYSYY
jgi:hypothetical protein